MGENPDRFGINFNVSYEFVCLDKLKRNWEETLEDRARRRERKREKQNVGRDLGSRKTKR